KKSFDGATFESISAVPKRIWNFSKICDFIQQLRLTPSLIDVSTCSVTRENCEALVQFMVTGVPTDELETLYSMPLENVVRLYRQTHRLIPDQVRYAQKKFKHELHLGSVTRSSEVAEFFAECDEIHSIYCNEDGTPKILKDSHDADIQ